MKEAEAEELETGASNEEAAAESTATVTPESSEPASESQGAEAKEGSSTAVKKKAAKKEEDLIDEAALEIKENRIGTIRTPHDGLVQQGDVFTTSLGRTPGGRGRDRGVSRDTF